MATYQIDEMNTSNDYTSEISNRAERQQVAFFTEQQQFKAEQMIGSLENVELI